MARKKKPHDFTVSGRRGGKIGGLSRSPAKLAAVRENGKLGGRPPKNQKRKSAGKPKA